MGYLNPEQVVLLLVCCRRIEGVVEAVRRNLDCTPKAVINIDYMTWFCFIDRPDPVHTMGGLT